MGEIQDLAAMGFSENKAKKALKKTKSSGIQPAIDWILAHPDVSSEPSDDEDDDTLDELEAKAKAEAEGGEAKSLKCMQCGKTFRNAALAGYHGDKSGHDQFEESTEEIKPLTEEEKKARLQELRDKMTVKKAAIAKKDAEEAKANEAIRRKAGKDVGALRQDMKLKEAEKQAAQAKKDKLEEAQAKARVKAQIEADKKARAEKAAKEKAIRSGTALPESSAPAPSGPSNPAAAAAATSSTSHNNARLQIRLPQGGQPLVTTMEGQKLLSDVAAYVSENAGLEANTLKFSTTFPRKTFSPEETSKTLKELGLCPSSVLMVSQ